MQNTFLAESQFLKQFHRWNVFRQDTGNNQIQHQIILQQIKNGRYGFKRISLPLVCRTDRISYFFAVNCPGIIVMPKHVDFFFLHIFNVSVY